MQLGPWCGVYVERPLRPGSSSERGPEQLETQGSNHVRVVPRSEVRGRIVWLRYQCITLDSTEYTYTQAYQPSCAGTGRNYAIVARICGISLSCNFRSIALLTQSDMGRSCSEQHASWMKSLGDLSSALSSSARIAGRTKWSLSPSPHEMHTFQTRELFASAPRKTKREPIVRFERVLSTSRVRSNLDLATL